MYSNLFVHVKNEIINLLFEQQKPKHDVVAFLTSRNASEHVLLSLVSIMQPGTPWSQNSPGFWASLTSYTLCGRETNTYPSVLPCHIGVVSPSFDVKQSCRVTTKVCSMAQVLVWVMSCTKCNVWSFRNMQLTYRTDVEDAKATC